MEAIRILMEPCQARLYIHIETAKDITIVHLNFVGCFSFLDRDGWTISGEERSALDDLMHSTEQVYQVQNSSDLSFYV